jgi:hypothetical protein
VGSSLIRLYSTTFPSNQVWVRVLKQARLCAVVAIRLALFDLRNAADTIRSPAAGVT